MTTDNTLGGCLDFESFYNGPDIDRAFTIGYSILDDRDEKWTGRFNRFKGGSVDSWKAGAAVLMRAVPAVLSDLGISGDDVTFAPALTSGETAASEKGVLGVLAKVCARVCGSEFSLELLSKKPHVRLHAHYRSVAERQSILSDAEYSSGAVSTPYVFVLDDFITSGSTLSEVASATKDANPGVAVYGVAVGKNERRSYLPSISNDHIPLEWDQAWKEYDGV